MESNEKTSQPEGVKSSFIPKQAISRQLGREHQPMGLFMLVSIVVLLISLLVTGGAYAWRYTLNDSIKKACPPDATNEDIDRCGLEAALTLVRDSIKEYQPTIDKVQKLDRQLRRAEELLTNHRTLLPLFALLEEETLQTVRYNSFDYKADGKVSFGGQAKSYESIALQSIEFAKSPFIKDFVFSGLNLGQDGIVVFKLDMEIDPLLTSYLASLNTQ